MVWESGCSWLKPECDTELVMLVCEQTEERVILRDKMFSVGIDWRDRAGLRMLEKQIANNLAQLGFTPADRARLGNTSVRVDALQEFRAKVQSQRSQA